MRDQTEGQPSDGWDDPLLTHVTRRAMATEFVAMLPAHAADAVETVVIALEQLELIENELTIYRDDSEVSRANRFAAERPVELSGSTFSLLQKAIVWSERTDGAFDITAGPLVEAWGFTRRSGQKPTANQIESARKLVGYRQLDLSLPARTVTLRRLACRSISVRSARATRWIGWRVDFGRKV